MVGKSTAKRFVCDSSVLTYFGWSFFEGFRSRQRLTCHLQIPFAELGRFSQVFAVGTGATAVPVGSITRLSPETKYEFASADGIGLELVKKLLATQRGSLHVDPSWCWEVKEKPYYTNGFAR